MKKHILYCLLSLLSFGLHAQVQDAVFVGAITTADKQTFSYKIQMTDSAGIITGYSITDVMGPDETKTLIRGTINGNQKQIKFKETRVVYTKSKSNELCFLNANLKVSSKKGTTILKGSFKGYKEDKTTECASGTLMLVSGKDIMDKLMQSDKKSDTMVAAIGSLLAPEAADSKTPMVMPKYEVPEAIVMKTTPGSIKELTCKSTTATLQVWDAKTIDGDIITILQNGKTILDNYKLKGAYKDLTLTLRPNTSDTLKVIAVNEGSEPLNTARIKITSGTETQYIDASTTMDKPTYIILKKN